MSGATIRVSSEDVDSALARILALAQDPSPMLKDIGEYQAESSRENIRAERSPDGTPFAPLNPAYELTKTGPGILREKGTLAQIVWQLAGSVLEVGTGAAYAAAHQFGAVIKPKSASALVFSLGGNRKVFASSVTIPARPFLGFSKDDETEIAAIARWHILNAAEKSSGGR